MNNCAHSVTVPNNVAKIKNAVLRHPNPEISGRIDSQSFTIKEPIHRSDPRIRVADSHFLNEDGVEDLFGVADFLLIPDAVCLI